MESQKKKNHDLHRYGHRTIGLEVVSHSFWHLLWVLFGGHSSSVVLMCSASSCTKNQGGLYDCLALEGDGNIPPREVSVL